MGKIKPHELIDDELLDQWEERSAIIQEAEGINRHDAERRAASETEFLVFDLRAAAAARKRREARANARAARNTTATRPEGPA